MKLVYIDDSADDQKNIACFSALIIDASQWHICLSSFEYMRKRLKEVYGIYTSRELHATKFFTGKNISISTIDKPKRVIIAGRMLKYIATRIPSLQIINVAMKHSEKETAFDWLLNRIDVNARKAEDHALIIADEGKDYNKLLIEKRKNNPIPSAYQTWESGDFLANIPIANIIERIWFRESLACHFIQAADFCAYALLRKEAPLPNHVSLGINKLFYHLEPALVKEACGYDKYGIIRRKKAL